jgi:hypothetical protein
MGVTKSFPGVRALKGVDLTIWPTVLLAGKPTVHWGTSSTRYPAAASLLTTTILPLLNTSDRLHETRGGPAWSDSLKRTIRHRIFRRVIVGTLVKLYGKASNPIDSPLLAALRKTIR